MEGTQWVEWGWGSFLMSVTAECVRSCVCLSSPVSCGGSTGGCREGGGCGGGCSQSVQQHRVVGGHLPETFTEQREWPPTPEGAGGSRSSVHSLREETSWGGFPFVRSLPGRTEAVGRRNVTDGGPPLTPVGFRGIRGPPPLPPRSVCGRRYRTPAEGEALT